MSRTLVVRSVGLIAVLTILLALYPAVSAAAALSVTESKDQNPPIVSDDQNSANESDDQSSATPPSVPSMSPNVFNMGGMQYPYTYYYYYYPSYSYNSSYCSMYYNDYYGYSNYGYYGYYPYYGYYGYPYDYSSCYQTTTTPQPTPTYGLQVSSNPSNVATVTGNGTYTQGTTASFSIPSLIVQKNDNQRYVFTSWSGDFSGSSPSGTVTMNSAKSVVANYQLQNYLKVSVDPQGITTATGEGWYVSTDSASVGSAPSSIPGGDGTRYIFQQWTVDNAPVSGNPVQVTMSSPHAVVAHYKTQYMLTVLSDYGIAQGTGWYDAGTSAPFSVTTQVDVSYGVKQVFDRWTGDTQSTSAAVTITMDSPHTVRAIWRMDSTVLYTTIAVGIAGAFVLGTGLAILGVSRMRGAKSTPAAQPTPHTTSATQTKKT